MHVLLTNDLMGLSTLAIKTVKWHRVNVIIILYICMRAETPETYTFGNYRHLLKDTNNITLYIKWT